MRISITHSNATSKQFSFVSDLTSVTVLPPAALDLINDKPIAPPGFHWIGDKPVLIYRKAQETQRVYLVEVEAGRYVHQHFHLRPELRLHEQLLLVLSALRS